MADYYTSPTFNLSPRLMPKTFMSWELTDPSPKRWPTVILTNSDDEDIHIYDMSHDQVHENFMQAPSADVNMSSPMKVVLLACGSFNPITNMHLRMFEIARDALHKTGRYRVVGGIMSPVNDNYDKKGFGKKDLATIEDRCVMIKRALKGNDWIRLDTWESEQSTWQETIKVLRHHREVLHSIHNANISQNPDTPKKKRKIDNSPSTDSDFGNIPVTQIQQQQNDLNKMNDGPVHLKLLCGADLLESMGRPGVWKDCDIEEIVSKYGIVCITRAGADALKFIYESDVLYKYSNNIQIVNEWIQNDISATKIRRALRRGESVKYLVQDPVIDYIMERQLYGAGDNKHLNYITPSPNQEDAPQEEPPEIDFLTPSLYRRLSTASESFLRTRSEMSSTESLEASPRLQRRSTTCIGADLTGLVRRVKNMRVALTPETCV